MKRRVDNFQVFYDFDPTDPPRFHHRVLDDEYFDWLFGELAGTGLTFLYRCNLAGRAYYPSRLMSSFDEGCVDSSHDSAQLWNKVAEMMNIGDPLASAVRAARKHGVSIWVWWNWIEFHNVRPGCVYLVDPQWYESPRNYWCSRDGSRFYHGVPDFGNETVRERLTGLARETLDYGVDGFYLSTRSHSWFACFPSPGWDEHLEDFGFNDTTIATYRERHGVDIRYEDYDRDELLRINGEHFTKLLTETGALLHGQGLPFILGISPNRHDLMGMNDKWPGKKRVQLYKDWENWARNGIIDGLCCEQTCPRPGEPTSAESDLLERTLPQGFPRYTWADTAYFKDRGLGPFHLGNWNPVSIDEMLALIEDTKCSGATGVILHSLYHYTSCDSGGASIGGYGVLPRGEYLDALRDSSW